MKEISYYIRPLVYLVKESDPGDLLKFLTWAIIGIIEWKLAYDKKQTADW